MGLRGPSTPLETGFGAAGLRDLTRRRVALEGSKKGQFGAEKGRFANKNRQKSIKIGEDFRVDLLMAKELESFLTFESV